MIRPIIAFILLLAASTGVLAQGALLQGGPWTQGHAPMYVGQGSGQAVVQDSGPAGGGAVGYGMGEGLYVARGTGTPPYAGQGTGPLGTNWCDYDAPITNPTGFHYFCISPNAQGGGLFAYGAGGAASQQPFSFFINGTAYQFPFSTSGVIGPATTTIGCSAPWANTVGTLLGNQCAALASTFVCDGTTDNSAAFAAQFATAVSLGTPFRITADKSGGKKCVFNSLTTINSAGVDSNGQPPSALVYIDPGVSVLFNGSTGWLKINGLFSGANDFRHSGVIGGNISVNPNGSTGTAYALTLINVNEVIIENVAFYNGLTGYVVGTSSNGVFLENVFAGEVDHNFFFNEGAAVNLVSGTTGPTNYVKVHNNEFASSSIVAINSGGTSGFPNTANMFFNNYFEANNQHISLGQYENNFQITGNYFNQGGCVSPCTSPAAYNGSDIAVGGIGGVVIDNAIVNSSDDQDINVTATASFNQVARNYISNNTLGTGSGAIVLASGSANNIVDSNNFNGSIPGPNTPVFNAGSGNQVGVNYYPSSPNGIANAWSLAQGGTNNSLTPSNGGLVYSDASKLDILAGTATAGQIPRSGASAAPSWSTFTIPATFAADALVYASGANVLAGLSTANSSVLVTNGSGVPSFATTLPSGLSVGSITINTINSASGNPLALNAPSGQYDALEINGGSLVIYNGTNLFPNADNTVALGGPSTNRWSNIYAAQYYAGANLAGVTKGTGCTITQITGGLITGTTGC